MDALELDGRTLRATGAVIEAASFCGGRFFTGQMTAAGKVPPAKVLIIGALAWRAWRLSMLRAAWCDRKRASIRALEVREQIQSMGAEFLEVQHQGRRRRFRWLRRNRWRSPEFTAAEMALVRQAGERRWRSTSSSPPRSVPGKAAPVLITEEMVSSMRQGSVIVDLAAVAGGNCAVTRPGEVVTGTA